MNLELQGKVALITGGSEGLGLATAIQMTKEGAQVAIAARTLAKLELAAEQVRTQAGKSPLLITADVSVPADCERAVAEVVARFGRLDILMNNAGSAAAATIEQVSDAEWEADIALKLQGLIHCSRAAAVHLKAAGGGAIINVLGTGAKTPGAGSLPSSVTRAGALALTKAMSKDLGLYGIRVNAVCIGTIRTPQFERIWQKESPELTWDEYSREKGKAFPLGRIGDADEAARVITFLASPAASYVTGVAVNIDGGASPVW
ncbi:SDR family NAD(P)-dependent oxidoreductase [Bacillus sp. OTU530]|uniref:SDR family NAD(P)-dependent oxidoreductase n=1 Tax=Bacillus sp. OTU530 TaxID=3043862 RepID=UPI00313D9365